MGQDLLQIGLEHHRHGRLTQAESAYRTLLNDQPDHAEAMHWLGVLHAQAGKWDEALQWLRPAAAGLPSDEAVQCNLGQACLNGGKFDEAVRAFESAERAGVSRPETQFLLGVALLTRRLEGDPQRAVDALRKAIALGMDSVDAHRQLGAALLLANEVDGALASLERALQKNREDAPARYLLAMAHQRHGKPNEVRKNLLKAVEIDPGFARAWGALGALEAQAGHWTQAEALYRRAIAAQPDEPAWRQALGQLLNDAGKPDAAAEALRQASTLSQAAGTSARSIAALERRITPDQRGAEMHYTLATITNLTAPAQIPPALLVDLFDQYANDFDGHIRGKLNYVMPERMADAIAAVRSNEPMDILDLGCGTGLCGPLLRPWASLLCGVDLSPSMIERAAERKVYDQLAVSDLVSAMRQAERSFDLLVAADVLEYIGDLLPVFEAAARCLRPGGIFAYSVECGGGDRYHLQTKSRRFAHSKPYIQKLAAMYGFQEESLEMIAARMEGGTPLPAYLVVLRLPVTAGATAL